MPDKENKEEKVATPTNATITTAAKITWNAAIEKYVVVTEKSFMGFHEVAGVFVEEEINELNFNARYLKAIAYDCVDELTIIAAAHQDRGVPFGNATIASLISGATITMKRTKFTVGSEYATADGVVAVHEHDGYNTELISIKPTNAKKAIIEKMMMASFAM